MGGGPPSLPIVSRTHSEQPEQLRDNPTDTLSVDYKLLRGARNPDTCLLGWAGDDGMNEVGINKGDLLLIEELDWDTLENGTVVATLLQDRLLPREYEFANRKIHLRPAAPHYAEKTFSPTDSGCYVIGRVLGLIRTLKMQRGCIRRDALATRLYSTAYMSTEARGAASRSGD